MSTYCGRDRRSINVRYIQRCTGRDYYPSVNVAMRLHKSYTIPSLDAYTEKTFSDKEIIYRFYIYVDTYDISTNDGHFSVRVYIQYIIRISTRYNTMPWRP